MIVAGIGGESIMIRSIKQIAENAGKSLADQMKAQQGGCAALSAEMYRPRDHAGQRRQAGMH
jgi:hypothetical protein